MFSVTFILGIWEEGAEGGSGFSFRTRTRDNIQAFLLSFELPLKQNLHGSHFLKNKI